MFVLLVVVFIFVVGSIVVDLASVFDVVVIFIYIVVIVVFLFIVRVNDCLIVNIL